MKNTNTIILAACSLFALSLFSCNDGKTAKGYTIKGEITGVDSGMVKLVKSNQEDRTSTTVDSLPFSGGTFELKGSVESPEMMTLTIEPGNWSFQVFVENSDIAVKADTAKANYYDWTSYGGSKGAEITDYTITGSQNQDNVLKYENDPGLNRYQPEFDKLNEAYKNASNKDESEEIRNQIGELRDKRSVLQKAWIDSFVTVNPSSGTGPYLFNNYYIFGGRDITLEEMEKMMNKFSGVAKSTSYYTYLTKQVEMRRAVAPGSMAPDFTLKKPDGSELTLSSLRGKYVMIDFWASWCVPCRQSIPHWKELYAKYHPEGFEILGITNDSKYDDWTKALDEEKMPWLQVTDEFPVKNMPARVISEYMAPYLPTYVLIDKDGKIVLHNATKEQISEKLKEVFGS